MATEDRAKTFLGRRSVLATVMAMAALGVAGAGRCYGPADLVDLSVVDRETGEPLRVWRHDGRLFVAGTPGARYSLRVNNRTDGRVLVVLSVDGVNILTGETANYDQGGYVFAPYQSYDLSGWRKSDTEIAAFTFAPLPQSYAARTGRPADVGVIGMAVFRERAPLPVPPPWPEASDGRAAPSDRSRRGAPGGAGGYGLQRPSPMPTQPIAPAAPASRAAPPPPAAEAQDKAAAADIARREDERLGTGHGAREWSVVTTVDFVRATSHPQSVRQIEYDTYDNLVAAGVIPWQPYAEHRPRPFPAYPDRPGYVPDPPPWDGDP